MASRKNTAITPAIQKRLKPLGGKSRRYIDPKTKKTYSRRQFEKQHIRKSRSGAPEIARKSSKYWSIVEIYQSTQKKKGKKLTKRQISESAKFKKIYRDLHLHGDKNRKKQQKAWEDITGGEKSEWTPYVQRWQKGEA